MKLERIVLLTALAFGFGRETTVQGNDYFNCAVNAITQVESSGNPNAERYEKHLDKDHSTHMEDTSYGLAQFIPARAKELEKRFDYLPRLGQSESEIIKSLKNPEINLAYLKANLDEAITIYGRIDLAAAAHNAGLFAPRNARIQQKLNDILGLNLETDGIIGDKTKKAIRKFQSKYGLDVDGIIGDKTLSKLNYLWSERFPNSPDPVGIIPTNGTTEFYVDKVLGYCN